MPCSLLAVCFSLCVVCCWLIVAGFPWSVGGCSSFVACRLPLSVVGWCVLRFVVVRCLLCDVRWCRCVLFLLVIVCCLMCVAVRCLQLRVRARFSVVVCWLALAV